VAALARFNDGLPHYKRIHAFLICPEAFTIENGLLTANGKLKRDAIAARYRSEIDAMYQKKTV
jgi:long-subunit acyl-CoA synthetase (AMP-forming)